MEKYIFVNATSIENLLKNRGLGIKMIKMDPHPLFVDFIKASMVHAKK
jgi:hypothetical protein